MKKVLLAAKNLEIGGIEKSLITLIHYFEENGYNVTLVLEERKGKLLKQISSETKVVEFKPCSISFAPLRKAINFIKQIKVKI